MTEVIDHLGSLVEHPVPVEKEDVQIGDVRRTGGSIDRAHDLLGWEPSVTLDIGLSRQLDHHRTTRRDGSDHQSKPSMIKDPNFRQ
jgi:nucleoside-diphosphate-sugar epimerase